MTQRNKNSIVAQPAEEPTAIGRIGFSLMSLPSKYPPVACSQRKRQLRLIRETRRCFPSPGRTKFTIHTATRNAVNDDDRLDAATGYAEGRCFEAAGAT